MDECIEAELIQEAAQELGIDVPVMSTRLVGNRLELYLYGGQMAVYTSPVLTSAAVDRDPASPLKAVSSTAAIKNIADYLHPAIRDPSAGSGQVLEAMNLVALRDLAQRWKVPGWNRLGKAKLIEALRMSTSDRNVRA